MDFEDEFLIRLREAIQHYSHGELIISMLKDAKCSFDVKSYENPDDLYTILYIQVPVQELFGFFSLDEYHEVILACAQKIFPKNRPPLDFVESFALFTHSVKSSTNKNAEHSHSIFGEPSTDSQFQCDIFVIMPFEFREFYSNYIERWVKELGLTSKLGDYPQSGKEIIHDIWSLLNNCKIVIADCTNLNPNVFYELGMAHATDKRAIIITRDNIENGFLPFDIAGKRAIRYQYHADDLPKLESKLKDDIKKLLGLSS